MLNFSKLLDWKFWFAMKPGPLGEKTVLVIASFFALLLAGAIVFRFLIRMKKNNPPLAKLFKKIKKLISTMAFVGFILLFLSYEQIYLLGAHFWFLFWFLGFLVWLGFIIFYVVKKMPTEKAILEEKKRFEKYLSK